VADRAARDPVRIGGAVNDSVLALTLAAAVVAGTPLALAALGELVTERSGILNLGVEGMMLLGAVTTFLVASATGRPWLAMAAGATAGAGLAVAHAVLSISLRANQIVSGLALVIFGTGLSTFLGRPVEGVPLPAAARLPRSSVPVLEDLPLVGRVLFQQDVVVYGTWLLTAAIAVYLFRTRPGLALRSVGESPATADAMGLRVNAIRYTHTIAGGLLCGTAGAYLMLVRVPAWSQASTTNGIGFIAIALVVFASWRPWRALLGAYIFGLALRANFALQAAGLTAIPAEFLAMTPYLLTILVLIALSVSDLRRRAGAPEALGVAYAREER
jgi:general nucleoside transport system permease protein